MIHKKHLVFIFIVAISFLANGQHNLFDADTTFYIYKEHKERSTNKYAFIEGHFIRPDSTPHIGEEVILTYLNKKKRKTYYTDSTGRVDFKVPPGQWTIHARKLGIIKKLAHFAFADHYVDHEKKTDKKYFESVSFYVYHWDEKLKLNISFEPSESTIKQTSYDKLDQVTNYLKRHKDINIEIIGHTDNTGNPTANLALSKQRAKAVKDYLVRAGISPDRLKTDGKGDTDPIASNDSEKGKAMNRRTELRILSE